MAQILTWTGSGYGSGTSRTLYLNGAPYGTAQVPKEYAGREETYFRSQYNPQGIVTREQAGEPAYEQGLAQTRVQQLAERARHEAYAQEQQSLKSAFVPSGREPPRNIVGIEQAKQSEREFIESRKGQIQQVQTQPGPGEYGYHSTPSRPGGISSEFAPTPYSKYFKMPVNQIGIRPSIGQYGAQLGSIAERANIRSELISYKPGMSLMRTSEKLQSGFERVIGYGEKSSAPIKAFAGFGSAFTGIPAFVGQSAISTEATIRHPIKIAKGLPTGFKLFSSQIAEQARTKPIEFTGSLVGMATFGKIASKIPTTRIKQLQPTDKPIVKIEAPPVIKSRPWTEYPSAGLTKAQFEMYHPLKTGRSISNVRVVAESDFKPQQPRVFKGIMVREGLKVTHATRTLSRGEDPWAKIPTMRESAISKGETFRGGLKEYKAPITPIQGVVSQSGRQSLISIQETKQVQTPKIIQIQTQKQLQKQRQVLISPQIQVTKTKTLQKPVYRVVPLLVSKQISLYKQKQIPISKVMTKPITIQKIKPTQIIRQTYGPTTKQISKQTYSQPQVYKPIQKQKNIQSQKQISRQISPQITKQQIQTITIPKIRTSTSVLTPMRKKKFVKGGRLYLISTRSKTIKQLKAGLIKPKTSKRKKR